jgi:HK97 family phage portal protein
MSKKSRIRHDFHKPDPTKLADDNLLGFALHASGRVEAIKQGSGMYGAGFGENAFSETAFGVNVALSQSTFGWSAAYSVSTWVYRCIEVRKSAIHRMPWGVYSKRTKRADPKHPLYVAMKRNRQKLLKKIEQSQLLFGESFIELPQNEFGFRSDLYWLNNNGMAVIVGAGQIDGYSYTAMQGGSPQSFNADEVVFMKTDNPFNDLRGMSPTEVIMDEVAIDKDVARVVRAYYANDTRVGVIFIPKTNLQQADQERFMAAFKRDNQGPNKAGKPVLMPQDMTVERVQEPMTLDDVQLRESTRREIAAAYGVPLSLAGGWDDAKYQSLPEQRKSFYEETVIPECDNIAEFINSDIMPHIDNSGNYEFKFDYISILALTEDAQRKNDIYSTRLTSGVITRAEARAALGHPVRDVDDVYYIPVGATIVPADQPALVTPTANEVDTTYQEQQQPQGQAPDKQLPPPKRPALPPPDQPKRLAPGKSIVPPQTNALDELNAWEKKALNKGAGKASEFVSYVLPKEVQGSIREALREVGKDANKAAVRAVFAIARKALTRPVEPDYWKGHDALMAELGHGWLSDYARRAVAALEPTADLTDEAIQTVLDAHHDEFSKSWLGTDAEPGPLRKYIQAGMNAASEVLGHPIKALPGADEARAFAEQYSYRLIQNVDAATRRAVREAVSAWVESGKPIDDLRTALTSVFDDPARAALVAETEGARAYTTGALARYQGEGVTKVKWNTVKDAEVCPTCAALAGTVATIGEGFKVDGGFPPAHPRCRCWLRPVVED